MYDVKDQDDARSCVVVKRRCCGKKVLLEDDVHSVVWSEVRSHFMGTKREGSFILTLAIRLEFLFHRHNTPQISIRDMSDLHPKE